jgi:autotransporter-associated beta strand protein
VANMTTFFEGLTAANVYPGGAIIDTAGYDITINQDLIVPPSGPSGGLTKQGDGTLLLNSAGNTYTGATLVTGGTLGGSGTIVSPTTVAAGGTLSPGPAGIGTLTINNSLTLQGSLLMEVYKDTAESDSIAGITTLTYGGKLLVTNLGATALVNGDSFRLFNASSYQGAFATIEPAPGPGLSWDTSRLAVDGTLRVKVGPATTPPTLASSWNGSQLNLSWPSDRVGWRLEAQTNALSLGLSTNWFTWPGSGATNAISIRMDQSPTLFLRLVYP